MFMKEKSIINKKVKMNQRKWPTKSYRAKIKDMKIMRPKMKGKQPKFKRYQEGKSSLEMKVKINQRK
jgi:hypothetical protein